MRYKGRTFYARVEEDDLLFDGLPTSPAQMVNTVTGTIRNAWRDLWIKMPGEREFIRADRARARDEERSRTAVERFRANRGTRVTAESNSRPVGGSANELVSASEGSK
jgi:hypothetical protein